MRKNKYPVAVTIRMTHEMHANLRRLAAGDRKVAGLIREMVRTQLDERAEIAGSRRHYGARFQERVDQLESHLEAYLALLAMLLTEFEKEMLFQLTYEEGCAPVRPSLFRRRASDGFRYLQDVRLVVDEIADIVAEEGDDYVTTLQIGVLAEGEEIEDWEEEDEDEDREDDDEL